MKAAGKVPEFIEQLQAGAAIGPTNSNPGVAAGAAQDVPAHPTTWVKVVFNGTTYWMPLYTVGS